MIKAPTNCPSCDYPLIREKDQLFCRNNLCEAQSTKRLEHFAKTMKIKGLGAKTIEALCLEDLHDIYTITSSYINEIIGEALGNKLYEEISKSKNAPLSQVIASLSIPAIGEGTAQKLVKTKINFWELTASECKLAGLGDVATTKLLKWIADNQNYKTLPLNFTSETVETVSTNFGTVCITGKLNDYKNRSEAKEHLTSLGYTVVDSVTKTVNFLVNEAGEQSSKTEKAAKYGIPTVTIKQLTEKAKENYDYC